MATDWQGSGPEYAIDWGGRVWTLRLNDEHPGLYSQTPALGPFLALGGLAETGRAAADALSGDSLTHFEQLGTQIEATYTPLGWGALTVRALWTPVEPGGMDLQVQAQAFSVGQLRAVEVYVFNRLAGREASFSGPPTRWVEPRDARAAALSYDGREPDLRRLTTLPPRIEAFQSPRLFTTDVGWLCAEMVHPDDISRRLRKGGRTLAEARSTQFALFGHDLEKGVIVRARLRVVWFPPGTEKTEALAAFDHFLAEPPPLRT